MSIQIKELLSQGALSVTIKVTQTHAVVICKMLDGETYKASGPSVDIALDRCLEKTEKHAKNVKRLRRQRERERQDILASLEEDTEEEGEEITTAEEWNSKSDYREKLDWD